MLPFCVTSMLGTVTDLYGSLLVDADGLKVIYHEGMRENVNPLDADVQTVQIPWAQVVGLRLEKGLLGASLIVDLTDDQFAKQVPFGEGCALEVTIRKADRERVKPFLNEARRYQAGGKDDDTDQFIDEMRDFLWDL